MFDDELNDLRDQEETLLEELNDATDEETRQQLLTELEDVQADIEEREEEQAAYMGMAMLEMLEEDERADDDSADEGMDDDFDF